MEPQDWVNGISGGLLIGVGAAFFLMMNGRIAGISGILGGLLDAPLEPRSRERLVFLAGLIGAPFIYTLAMGAPDLNAIASPPVLIAGGLLVGFGSRAANGCTSGHGVCGMSRLSPRSITAMGISLVTAIAVVAIARHFLPLAVFGQ